MFPGMPNLGGQGQVPEGDLQTNPQQPFSLFQTMKMRPASPVQQPQPPQFPGMMFHRPPQMGPLPPPMMMMLQRMGGPGMGMPGGEMMPGMQGPGMGPQQPNPIQMLLQQLMAQRQGR